MSQTENDQKITSLEATIKKLERELAHYREEEVSGGVEVTASRQLKTTLRERESRLKMLYENSRDYVYGIASDGTMISLNPAFETITGFKTYEWIGRNFSGLVHPDDREQAEHNLELALKQSTPPVNELRILKKSGEYVVVEFKGQPMNEGGEVTGVFGIARDITKRKKVEEALRSAKEQAEAATKLKDDFISLVSHDLRSPLGSLLMILKELEGCVKQSEELKQDKYSLDLVDKAVSTGSILIDTIDQLLDVSRLQTGKVKLRPYLFNVWSMAQETVEMVTATAEKKKISIQNNIAKDSKLFADRNLATQVLGNFISNALKFCPGGGKITIFTPEDSPATIAVKDTGKGVDEAIIPNLFRHEVNTSTVGLRGERGTGLGLPLSRDIMTLHGGDITVESSSENGSVFYMNFPEIEETGSGD